jgi:multidrug resistance efflux pump
MCLQERGFEQGDAQEDLAQASRAKGEWLRVVERVRMRCELLRN